MVEERKSKLNTNKFDVSPAFRTLLLDFTVTYLIEQPQDIITFGLNYFTELKNKYQSSPNRDSASVESEIEESRPPPRSVRRQSVFAEAYNPEDDEDEDEDERMHIYPKTDVQRKQLEGHLKAVLLFGNLDKEQLNTVLDAMFLKRVSKGDVIIREGDDGDYFYVIQDGTYNAYVTINGIKTLVRTYEEAGSFGELALMYSTPRAATVTAAKDGSLWALDRATFRKIVLKSAFKKRKLYENLIEKVPMLSYLNSYEKMNLADALQQKTYKNGEIIMREGDEPDGMYFVESGSVVIKKIGPNGNEVTIDTIQAGGYFGELALLSHNKRAASVYAKGEVSTAFLNVEAFERLLGPCKEIMSRNIAKYN